MALVAASHGCSTKLTNMMRYVPPPANLPSIVHRSAVAGTAPVLYFMIPQETDFLNDDIGILLSRTSPILPSDQCAGSVSLHS